MPKGTSQAGAMSNSEKIKPVALAIIELRWSNGIRQWERSHHYYLMKNTKTYENSQSHATTGR